MKKRDRRGVATRFRMAALLLLAGCLLPMVAGRRAVRVPAQVEKLLAQTIPPGTAQSRTAFVRTACGLVGQVDYFWGGKSHTIGWDGAWGWPRRVTAAGSGTTGRIRPYGLDCSGLVSWAAATAQQDPAAYDRVGEGVRTQYSFCVPAETPRPGDLAFFPDLSHVGIVLGRDGEGRIWVVHCSASLGGVVVTPASVGFSLYGTPIFLTEGLDNKIGFLYSNNS